MLQNPENQIVTDKVWHELAFGLESLGKDNREIRLRTAEMASFFGIQNWFHKSVTELSGGQKQLLNLASIMAMQPSALILDEPTSQLDPIAASEFLAAVQKVNRELSVTVLMTEQRLEEAFPMSDRILVMEGGSLRLSGSPREVGRRLSEEAGGMFLSLPATIWEFIFSIISVYPKVFVLPGYRQLLKIQSSLLPNRNFPKLSLIHISEWIFEKKDLKRFK